MYKDTRKSLVECGVEQIELGGTVYELNTAEAVGRGGSCLVYHAVKKDAETSSRDRKVIIKEFYPFHKDSGSWRKESGQLDIPDTAAEIRQKREQFERSFERFTQLYNIGLDNNVVTAETIEQTGSTLYMVMEYSSGITLNEYMKTCSLYEFFKVMQNLAGVLGVLHRSGYIHMDVKPQNILCLAANPAWPDRREQTRLLDTDSFILKAKFPVEIAKNGLSGSPGYTAPEVAEIAEDPDDILLAEDFLNVGECTDMYSFGVILYAYIFGEIPEAPYETNHTYENRLDEYLQKKYEDIPHKAVRYIRNILKNTLAKDPYTRHEQYAAMEDIGKEIEKLLPMINAGEVRMLEIFSPNPDPVIGRERQLAELECLLRSESKGGRVVCITGIGGIGKSALARHYAKKHIDAYDMITEVSADSAEKAVTGIHILNWEADEKSETAVSDQYKKKLANLSARYRMLILVNDYDVSSDPGFGIWKELGNCDVILTSRYNWSSRVPTVELHSEDLEEEHAKEIFLHYYLQDVTAQKDRERLSAMIEKEGRALKRLLSALSFYPLGIKLTARSMAAVPGEELGPQQGLKTLEQLFFKDSAVKVSENKDSRAPMQENMYAHLEALFKKSLENGRFTDEEQKTLRCMTLIPSAYGISPKRFGAWTGLSSICLVNLSRSGWLEYHPNRKDILEEDAPGGVYSMPLMIAEFLRRGAYFTYTLKENLRYTEALTNRMRSTNDTNRALWEHGEMIIRNFPEDHTKEYLCLLMETARAYKPWLGRDVYTEENADRYWQKCIELCRYHPEEPLLVCECCFRLAELYTSWGEFGEGLQLLNKGWTVLRTIPIERLSGDQLEKFVRLFYGICQRCQQKGVLLDITLPLLQFWRMLLKAEAGWEIQIGGLLADNYQLLGYYKAAENVRNTTIDRCRTAANRDSYEQRSTLRSLLRAQGKLSLETDQPDKALQYLGRSMQIGQALKEQDRGFISNALIYELIGDAYALKEDYVRAAQYHQRAIGKGFANVMADVALPMKLALDFENWKDKKDFASMMAGKYWDRVLWIARGACKETDIQNREDVLEAMLLWAKQYFDGDHILWGMQAMEKRAELARRVYGCSREMAEEYLRLAGMFKSYGLSRRSRAYKRLAGKCKHFKKKG